MNKKFVTILLVLFYAFLVIVPLNGVKAENSLTSKSVSTQFKNGRIERNMVPQPNLYKYINRRGVSYNVHSNILKKDGILEFVIKFVDKIILGIIFLCLSCYFIWHYCIHNFLIRLWFKRERIEKDENFKIARCKEEKTKKRVYIIYKKNNNCKGKYYHIVDNYTFKKLGYNLKDDASKDKEFSRSDYKEIGKRIELYDVKRDILLVIGSAEKIKAILGDMGDIV